MSASQADARSLSSQADYTDAYQSHGEQYSELRSALKPPLTVSPQDVRKDPEEDSYLLSEMYVKQRMSELRIYKIVTLSHRSIPNFALFCIC